MTAYLGSSAPSFVPSENRLASSELQSPRRALVVVDDTHDPVPSQATPESVDTPSPQELLDNLKRAVARICPSWLIAERDDLVQTAILRVLEIGRRQGGDRVLKLGYLYRVAHSVLIDEIRRRRRRSEISLSDSISERSDGQPGPEHQASINELGRAVRSCLGEVHEHRRLAVALHMQEYTVPECARELGWSQKRTENLVYRGKADLRQRLEARGVHC